MPSINVDVDLDDFSDDEIIREFAKRDLSITYTELMEAVTEIYHLRRLGKPYVTELDKFISDTLGVVI